MEKENPKILVLDDEKEFLKLIKMVLFDNGYSPILATSGDEALEKLKMENDIAVILADHRMPGMKGIEFLEKAKHLAPFIPRIIMTAYQNAEMMEDSINKAEVYRFLTKPIQFDNLLNILKVAVERYRFSYEEVEHSKKS